MPSFTIATTVPLPFEETVDKVRLSLAEQGFGVLSEIDLTATLKAKLDVEIAPQLILGACRPPLAHRAITIDPSIAAVLPCNVVVRADGDASTIVEAFDPDAMLALAAGTDSAGALAEVAADAKERLTAMLAALGSD